MILLALDVGNSFANAGLFCDGRLLAHDRTPTAQFVRSPRRLPLGLLKSNATGRDELSGVAVASVVPAATDACRRLCRDRLQIRPFIITGTTSTRLNICYHPAKSLGPDRLMAAVAASHIQRPPVVCVSFGTATVVDAVSRDYEFLGGAIFPGLDLLSESLANHTALLPSAEPRQTDCPIGDNTISALRAGAVFGSAYALEGLVREFRNRIGKRAGLVITGGYASLVMPHLRGRFIYRPHLALEGIWLAWSDRMVRRGRGRKGAKK